jgi:hypothetical protein
MTLADGGSTKWYIKIEFFLKQHDRGIRGSSKGDGMARWIIQTLYEVHKSFIFFLSHEKLLVLVGSLTSSSRSRRCFHRGVGHTLLPSAP